MKEEKKKNSGCANIGIVSIILVFILPIWGLSGMIHGGSFIEGIQDSLKASISFIAVGVFTYWLYKTFGR
ncbi:hypothetical protein [Flavobacterium sp. FlaQc-28]|uniref:hypothetical protein n=1 Tax=Flavobacterium sp. FlaQc-28 TaxID=3374178 RepID=UPI0037580C90